MRDRLLRHACALLAVAALTLLAPHALPHVPPARATAASGTPDAALTRSGATIEAALPAPVARALPGETILVAPGETLASLAASLHRDAAAMRWANNILDVTQPAPGSALLVPPGPGALVPVLPGEAPSHFAVRLGLDPRVLLDYNALRSDAPLPAGSYLQVPLAAAPAGSLESWEVVPVAPGIPGVPSTQYARADAGRFPWGQCTYYVWTRRFVPWNGDAWTWVQNAHAAGRPIGRIPVQGAIAVMWGSWVGHVAFVEHVNPDGSFLVSEMNVRGLGVVDQRTLTVAGMDLIGFIY